MMTTKIISVNVKIPADFKINLHESCRKNDKEPFCAGLTKEINEKYEHHYAFSGVSFEDAIQKCLALFETEQSKRYWAD